MIRNKTSASHMTWGAGCDAWELMATVGLSVKVERMPAGTEEIRHHHARSEQFFFVLKGELVLEIEGMRTILKSQDGASILPSQRHQAINESTDPVEFLVISAPPTAGDRIE